MIVLWVWLIGIVPNIPWLARYIYDERDEEFPHLNSHGGAMILALIAACFWPVMLVIGAVVRSKTLVFRDEPLIPRRQQGPRYVQGEVWDAKGAEKASRVLIVGVTAAGSLACERLDGVGGLITVTVAQLEQAYEPAGERRKLVVHRDRP